MGEVTDPAILARLNAGQQAPAAPRAGPPAFIPGVPKPVKPERPNLPQGYEIGPDGKTARRIPGLPPEKVSPDSGVGKAMTQNKRSEMMDSLTALDQFEADLVSLEGQFKKNFENQGLATVREVLPEWANTTNQDYNRTSQRLLPLVAKALGFASKQMDTPAELARLESYIPKNTDGDETARHKLKVLRDMMERQRGNLRAQLGEQPAKPAPKTKAGGFKFLGFE